MNESPEIQNVTCPLCGIGGFSASGLNHHRCRATPDRRRLTPQERVGAILKAKAEQQPATPNPQPAKQ